MAEAIAIEITDDQQEEEAADCELLPHKPAAAGSQESDFGSLLGKRNYTNQIEDVPENWAELEEELPSEDR